MFIHSQRGGYDRHGGQWSSGAFLMLCLGDAWKPWTGGNLRAMVRHVKLRQLGHFMAGHAIIPTTYQDGELLLDRTQADIVGMTVTRGAPLAARAKLYLSGTFGSDGLPMHVPTKVTLDKGLREQPVNLDWRCLKLDNGQPYYTPKEHTAESPCWYSRGVPWQVYERMAPVPDEIAMAVGNDDTGHNSAGVQAIGKLGPWARGNLRALQRAGGPRSPWPKPVPETVYVKGEITLGAMANDDFPATHIIVDGVRVDIPKDTYRPQVISAGEHCSLKCVRTGKTVVLEDWIWTARRSRV